jgi:hypothetical protein
VIAVACHDAGGAELVSSLAGRRGLPVRAVLDGPAVRVFARKLPGVVAVPLAEALAGASQLICGTSWPATLEWDAIAAARSAGVPSVAMLDHWVNYRRRFERDGVWHFPDAVWVGDATAERLARRDLPEVPVQRIDNPYRLDIVEQVTAAGAATHDGVTILYVTEPTAQAARRLHGDPRFFGYTEDEALRGFLARVAAWPDVRAIVIRAHPSEPPEKYAWACVDPRVRLDATSPLVAQLAWADVVVGCNSMAMIVATWVGKRVLCAIPEGGRGFALPTEGIEFLSVIDHPITKREPA